MNEFISSLASGKDAHVTGTSANPAVALMQDFQILRYHTVHQEPLGTLGTLGASRAGKAFPARSPSPGSRWPCAVGVASGSVTTLGTVGDLWGRTTICLAWMRRNTLHSWPLNSVQLTPSSKSVPVLVSPATIRALPSRAIFIIGVTRLLMRKAGKQAKASFGCPASMSASINVALNSTLSGWLAINFDWVWMTSEGSIAPWMRAR